MDERKPAVTVLPGVPGMDGLQVDDGRVPYPESTQDFVKVLRERGFQVEFMEPSSTRRYIGYKASDIWLPILEFHVAVLAGSTAGILVELVNSYIDPFGSGADARATSSEGVGDEDGAVPEAESQAGFLHVDWRVTTADGHRERLVAEGSTSDVLHALQAFEQHVRDL